MEEIQAAEVHYRLIRLPQYEKDLKGLKRLEPRLHEEIRASLKKELESGKLDEIKGTGGWVKGRAASPTRNIGKSGGFRFLYYLFRVQYDIYLQSVYDHRVKNDLSSDEKKALKAMAEAYKKAYENRGRTT
jgi:hypothetical protein